MQGIIPRVHRCAPLVPSRGVYGSREGRVCMQRWLSERCVGQPHRAVRACGAPELTAKGSFRRVAGEKALSRALVHVSRVGVAEQKFEWLSVVGAGR